jgi:SNF2-related domain/SNF2 Helicase protein/Helicase conserved C-terminal domain
MMDGAEPSLSRCALRLSPSGHLVLEANAEAPAMEPEMATRLHAAFARGSGHGLLQLGAGEVGVALPPVFGWWRSFASRYVTALRLQEAGLDDDGATINRVPEVTPPEEGELATLVLTAPMMVGAEYLTPDLLRALWAAIEAAFAVSLAAAGTDLQSFLKSLNPAWNLLGRVHFNLAENRRDTEAPFAFMATYTTQLSAQAKVQHLPLGQALRDYAGEANRGKLLTLLVPVQRAAERCGWLRQMTETGEIYHPLRWTPRDATQFLASAGDFEQAGIIVRMPANWQARRPSRPRVTATIGNRAPSALGLDGLLDFEMDVTLDGERLTPREIDSLLAGTDQLVLLRGKWVEVDRKRIEHAMRRFREAETLAARQGVTFAQAMRLLSGVDQDAADDTDTGRDWSQVVAGDWLAETLRALRAPGSGDDDPGPALRGTLRPYQKAGVRWLRLLSGLGLGACLADDMGLGKTIQVLALLLMQQGQHGQQTPQRPSLLVAPASLLANWAAEIERFAPALAARVMHPSVMGRDAGSGVSADQIAGLDLVITSYGTLMRSPALAKTAWRFAILDEAQAIKNPAAKQTRAAKALRAEARIALTGTPVENALGDLWSIFDFINPGLLGSARQFAAYAKGLAGRTGNPYGPLRDLVRPYILRRMKTDKTIIADLPDKTEVNAHCLLSRKQAALYAETVQHLARSLEEADGIQRRGLVLASLMRLKQICNHPSQWLNDGVWGEAESGKFVRLREIADVVGARQEKMLVFTQFREITEPLAGLLGAAFGRKGLVLHGGTAVRQRKALVQRFQEDEDVPFFVLSLKAGGTGLTLTAASHVVHFDRWWNPAVENQATDRAFRIGQKSNVLVHKFLCRGTVEERIDALIESKKSLSTELLSGGAELDLTELDDAALMDLIALDLDAVVKD